MDIHRLMRYNGGKLNISLKEKGDDRKDVIGSVKNSVFMDPHKISDLFGNLNKVNTTVEKISKAKKIKSKSPRNPIRRLWIFFIFFKIIGFATFTYCIVTERKKTLSTFRYSKIGVAYNIILISLLIASNFITIPYRITMEYQNKSNLTQGIEILQTILGTIVMCMILLNYCIHQKRLVRIANWLVDIEHEIDHLYQTYYPLQRQRIRFTLIIASIMKISVLTTLLGTEIYAFHTGPISWLSDILPTFHVGWLMMQYFLLVTIIQADFTDVNHAIQSLSSINTPDLRPQSLFHQSCPVPSRRIIVNNSVICQLLQLRDIHCHLCDICENISGFYSLPMLLAITFAFLTLIYNSYYLLFPLIISDEILQYDVFANTVFWLISLIYPIILLTNRISKILNEVGHSSILLN